MGGWEEGDIIRIASGSWLVPQGQEVRLGKERAHRHTRLDVSGEIQSKSLEREI